MQEFTDIVNERYDESLLQDGYAPFCKHLFVVNDFTDARVNVLRITPENEGMLRSKYEARNELEVRDGETFWSLTFVCLSQLVASPLQTNK